MVDYEEESPALLPVAALPPEALSNGGDRSGESNESRAELLASYYDTIAFERTVGIVIPTIYSLVILVGLIGNVLVITVVLLNRHMRNSTNMLIINLAFADLLFLVLCVPFTAAEHALPIWVFSHGWCQVLQYLQYVSAYASVWTLVLMALDRFLAVCLPIRSLRLRTVRNTIAVSALKWVLILLCNVPLLKVYGILQYHFAVEERATCTFVAEGNRTATEFEVRLHHLWFVVWGYLLPLSITCVLYFYMLRRLWWRTPATLSASRASEESIRSKKKVTWMVTGVIVTFSVCWLPLNTCFAVSSISYRQNAEPWLATKEFVIVQFASQILAYANSCLNPILYAFLSEAFRKGFFKICGFLFCGSGDSRIDWDRTDKANTNRSFSTAAGYSTTSNGGGGGGGGRYSKVFRTLLFSSEKQERKEMLRRGSTPADVKSETSCAGRRRRRSRKRSRSLATVNGEVIVSSSGDQAAPPSYESVISSQPNDFRSATEIDRLAIIDEIGEAHL